MPVVSNWKIKRVQIREEINKEFNHSTPMMTTDISKVVLNSSNRQNIEEIKKMLQQISQGQESAETHARHDIVSFNKLRKGMKIGQVLTMRGERAWNFLFNLFNFGLPNTRDFKGLNIKGFDKQGNFNLGIRDSSVFPEAFPFRHPLQITIVFSGNKTEENKTFLDKLGSPFSKKV